MTIRFDDPVIDNLESRSFAMIAGEYTKETRYQIPQLWGQLWGHDFGIEGLNTAEAFGLSFSMQPDGSFRYGAGFALPGPDFQPSGGCVTHMPAGLYAKFQKRTPMTEIPALFDWVYCDWLPNSGYLHGEGGAVEHYPEDPEATEHQRLFGLWVPISQKA